MAHNHRGPTADEMGGVLERLEATLTGDPRREELLDVEMTLRGMLPDIETLLQRKLNDPGGRPGESDAIRRLMRLSGILIWAQMHAHGSADEVRRQLLEAIDCARRVMRFATE